jgi:pSer/pThr/pTyr-binding forkhead associated (FHA) protein
LLLVTFLVAFLSTSTERDEWVQFSTIYLTVGDDPVRLLAAMGVRLVVRSTWSSEETAEYVYEFAQTKIVVGRHPGSDVHLPHPAVSGHHASIRVEGTRLVIVDEGSTNGTRVDGERIPQGRPKPLTAQTRIDLGGFRLSVESRPVVTGTSHDETAALARQMVREALGDGGDGAGGRLRVLNGPAEGTEVAVPPPPAELILGRGDDVDLTLPDEDLSREHVALRGDLDGIELRDLGSKNGSFVNDKPVTRRRLRDGDEIRLGKTMLLFSDPTDRELRTICSAPEKVVALPEPPPEEPEEVGESAEAGKATEAAEATEDVPRAAPSVSPAPKRTGVGADVIIYVLAGAVLALSIAGLVMLLRAG